jgi:carboxymethylenebutenolidase
MAGQTVKVTAPDGVVLDCYVALPSGTDKAPCIVMSAGAFGVNKDLMDICDWWASKGFMAAAPEQWARGDKGPVAMNDEGRKRAMARIATPGIVESVTQDLDATLKMMRAHPRCNGKTAIMGYCFGGPFAVIGITQLGCDAGGSYHGGSFAAQIDNLKTTTKPIQIHWGDKDFALTPELLEKVRAACAHNPNAEIFIYPGIEHGYTAPESAVYSKEATALSWERSLQMFDKLKNPPPAKAA